MLLSRDYLRPAWSKDLMSEEAKLELGCYKRYLIFSFLPQLLTGLKLKIEQSIFKKWTK
jgi:hypothetical protein